MSSSSVVLEEIVPIFVDSQSLSRKSCRNSLILFSERNLGNSEEVEAQNFAFLCAMAAEKRLSAQNSLRGTEVRAVLRRFVDTFCSNFKKNGSTDFQKSRRSLILNALGS